MEGLVVLLVLGLFVLPIVAIILATRALGRIESLQNEFRTLAAELREWEEEEEPASSAPKPPAPAPPIAQHRPAPPAVAEPTPRIDVHVIPGRITVAEASTLPLRLPTDARPAPTEPAPVEAPEARPPAEPRVRLEEQLGARLPVWLGSIALFLAGAFLVKYTFDRGLLTPAARVLIGAAFGLFLLGAGEWLRKRAARIAQGVTAAGVADLFACVMAALSLYHLVDRTTGFALLVATAALAVILSLRQGPFVALLGLLGGFLTPALIGSTEPQPGPLFTYLLVLQIGLLVVVRRREWWPLAGLTLIGAFSWTVIWLVTDYRPEDSVWMGPFLIGSIAAFVAAMYRSATAAPEQAWIGQVLSLLGAVAGMIMLAVLVGASHFSTLDWAFLGVLGAATLVLGRLDERYEPLAWAAAGLGVALLIAWNLQMKVPDAARFAGTAFALGGLYAFGAYVAHWRTPHAARWASLSVAAANVYLLVCYWAVRDLPWGWRWGTVCLVLAAVYALFAVPHVARPAEVRRSNGALAALLTAVTGFVSLAIPIELERAWIAVAWALEIPALALLAAWLCVPALRVLAAILAGVVTVWLFHPGAFQYPLGTHPFFDWILYGYGISALAFAAGAWLFHRQGAQRLAEGLESGTALFVFALVTLKVRRFFHPAELHAADFSLNEWATYVNAWLILGGIALLAARSSARRVQRSAGHVISLIGAVGAILVLCLLFNPLWRTEPLGTTPVFNYLLYIYALPGVLALVLAGRFFQRGDTWQGRAHAAVGVALFFMLLSLEIRHFFHGERPGAADVGLREWAAYVNGWLILGGVALAASRLWHRDVLRSAGDILSLGGAVVAVLALCLFCNPLWQAEPVGQTPVLNHLLYIYGLPAALALVLGGRFFQRSDTPQGRAHSAMGVLLFFVLVSLQVRHFFHGPRLDIGEVILCEWSTYGSAWLILGTIALAASRSWQPNVLRVAGYAQQSLAAATAVLALGLVRNPVWHHEAVGTGLVLNDLLYVYGVPALLYCGVGRWFYRRGALPAARAAAGLGLLLVFLLVSLEVRQAFRGEFLDGGASTSAESYAYSAAWALLGTLLLVAGIVSQGLVLRSASLAVMLLAVGKVFLFDTAHLRDLYRVFSLLGLGLSLLVLAFLYQRFVFPKRAPAT